MGFIERFKLKRDYKLALEIVAPADDDDIKVTKENTAILARAVRYMVMCGMSEKFKIEYENMYVDLHYPRHRLFERIDQALEESDSEEVPPKQVHEPSAEKVTISEQLIYDLYERFDVEEYLETLAAKMEVLLVLLARREEIESKSASWRTDYRWAQLYYVLCDFYTIAEVLLKISR